MIDNSEAWNNLIFSRVVIGLVICLAARGCWLARVIGRLAKSTGDENTTTYPRAADLFSFNVDNFVPLVYRGIDKEERCLCPRGRVLVIPRVNGVASTDREWVARPPASSPPRVAHKRE
ncbi:jg10354 [Pararge aegeria aegeria]|uniref:Jg10354 protein n=1 Tax=Pararge aegeria aegeria TaxID=348720 RepID=A0A8S4SN16_9NEOP|nr:jg10354 [Pararge aegeria aegeria]